MIRSVLVALALLIGLGATAATKYNEYFTIDNVQIDKEGKGTVYVWFNTESDVVNAFQMDFYFPEGFEIEKNARGNYKVSFYNGEEDTSVTYDHSAAVGDHRDDGYFRIVAYSPSAAYVLPGYHAIFQFSIVAPEGFDKEAVTEVSHIELGGDDAEPVTRYCDPISFEILPYENIEVGVDEITVSDTDAPEAIYDLLGHKVSAPLAPGIYIVNGRKRVVR